jgi:hypothetical protein
VVHSESPVQALPPSHWIDCDPLLPSSSAPSEPQPLAASNADTASAMLVPLLRSNLSPPCGSAGVPEYSQDSGNG